MSRKLLRDHFATSLTIASGGSVTSDYVTIEQRAQGSMLAVYVPDGFQGVLIPKVSDTHDGTFDVVYDQDGYLISFDPTGAITPCWWMVKSDVFPAHYIKFASVTNTNGTAGTAQSAERTLRVMGLS